jgi:hypothetical protein
VESTSPGWLIEVRLFFRRPLLRRVSAAHHALQELHEKEKDHEHSPALPKTLETPAAEKTA